MKTNLIKIPALALIATATLATAVPAQAQYRDRGGYEQYDRYERNGRYDRRDDRRYVRRDDRRYDSRYDSRASYGEPVNRNTRVWRGNDGRAYCQKKDGTTGLIIGAAAGALIGRQVDGGRNRTLGTVLGAAAGALLGKEVAQGNSRCR